MAASATDKFKKLARRWTGQVGSGGVADATTTTIPLASSTNLPTDTAVVVVIDRVDANGAATPSLEETAIGVVSSTNLINCVRGAEGTAQAHLAGAVVEILVTAKGWNDLVDGLLVGHNQDGSHASGITLSAVTLTSPVIETVFTAKGEYSNGNSSTAITIDLSKGDRQSVTLTGNCTFTWSNPSQGQSVILRIVEDGTGGRTVTLPTGKWPGGTAGTFTTTASAINLLVIYYDGTNYLYQLAAGFS